MSASYGIDIYLAEEFNKSNINFILKKGLEVGLIYYKDIFDAEDYKKFELINIDEAVQRILNFNTIETEYGPLIVCKFFDTGFPLWIYNYKETLHISIGNFQFMWEKLFWNKQGDYIYADIGRYINLLLQLADEFTITKIEKWSEYE